MYRRTKPAQEPINFIYYKVEMCNMLINRIFSGNDAVFGLTGQAVDEAIRQHGADMAVGFPNTAYCLPCYYAVTGVKIKTLGELKEALGVVKR